MRKVIGVIGVQFVGPSARPALHWRIGGMASITRIARRGVESSQRLDRHRWLVERTLAWFSRYRRLTVRYERRADIHLAFHHLAASLICLNFVRRWFC